MATADLRMLKLYSNKNAKPVMSLRVDDIPGAQVRKTTRERKYDGRTQDFLPGDMNSNLLTESFPMPLQESLVPRGDINYNEGYMNTQPDMDTGGRYQRTYLPPADCEVTPERLLHRELKVGSGVKNSLEMPNFTAPSLVSNMSPNQMYGSDGNINEKVMQEFENYKLKKNVDNFYAVGDPSNNMLYANGMPQRDGYSSPINAHFQESQFVQGQGPNAEMPRLHMSSSVKKLPLMNLTEYLDEDKVLYSQRHPNESIRQKLRQGKDLTFRSGRKCFETQLDVNNPFYKDPPTDKRAEKLDKQGFPEPHLYYSKLMRKPQDFSGINGPPKINPGDLPSDIQNRPKFESPRKGEPCKPLPPVSQSRLDNLKNQQGQVESRVNRGSLNLGPKNDKFVNRYLGKGNMQTGYASQHYHQEPNLKAMLRSLPPSEYDSKQIQTDREQINYKDHRWLEHKNRQQYAEDAERKIARLKFFSPGEYENNKLSPLQARQQHRMRSEMDYMTQPKPKTEYGLQQNSNSYQRQSYPADTRFGKPVDQYGNFMEGRNPAVGQQVERKSSLRASAQRVLQTPGRNYDNGYQQAPFKPSDYIYNTTNKEYGTGKSIRY